jgi:hypothetical protein
MTFGPKSNQLQQTNKYGLGKKRQPVWLWWLMPVILTTWEAEIRRIEVPSQLRQIVFYIMLKYWKGLSFIDSIRVLKHQVFKFYFFFFFSKLGQQSTFVSK